MLGRSLKKKKKKRVEPNLGVHLIIWESQFMTLTEEALHTGWRHEHWYSGHLNWALSCWHSPLFPRVSSSSKGHSEGPGLAYDTDPQTGTHSGPGICL